MNWTGCDLSSSSGQTKTCELDMGTADQTIRATFTPPPPTVSIDASSSIIRSGDGVTLTFNTPNNVLSITANGAPASCTIAGSTCVIARQVDTTTYRITVANARGQASATVTVYVNNPPSLSIPQAFQPAGVTMNAGDTATIGLTGHDPDGCSYSYSYAITAQPSFVAPFSTPGTMTCSNNGDLSATLSYTPAAGSSGSTTLSFTISDGANISNERTVSISVR